ncbi:tRNA ligase subunit PheS family protein [Streptomyces sp. SS8]
MEAKDVVDGYGWDVDLTLRPVPLGTGGTHPVSVVTAELRTMLESYGFDEFDAPVVVSAEFNFDRLGVPAGAAVRDERRNFWLDDGHLLRSHTSAGVAQLIAHTETDDLRAFVVGPCFRHERRSARSAWQFTQMDAVLAGREVRPAHLTHLLTLLGQEALGTDWPIQIRPVMRGGRLSGWSLHAGCRCAPDGECALCRGSRWLELAQGSVLPAPVLDRSALPLDEGQAVACGLSLDRVVLLRWGLDDIGLLMTPEPAVIQSWGAP